MNSFEKMYCVKEAADILGASVDSVRRWIHRRELKAWKYPCHQKRGRRTFEVWRIAHSELIRFMKRNENGEPA
jgi:excisionase family DNA binding protein